MKVYGQEIDFRITRIDDAQRYKAALDEMQKDEQKLQKLKRSDLAVFLKSYIEMFQKFFINATGVDVLAGCNDAQEAHDAYISFLREIKVAKIKMASFSIEDTE